MKEKVMFKVDFLFIVYEDIEEITDWYEKKQEELSLRFQQDLEATTEKLSIYPDAFRTVYKDYRSLNLSIFLIKFYIKYQKAKKLLLLR